MWKKILKQLAVWFLDLGFNLLFKAMDKNKDGQLSKTEIREAINWVKNKAKNYNK